MSEREDLLREAYKRNLLPPEERKAYEEAQRRGLIGGPLNDNNPSEFFGLPGSAPSMQDRVRGQIKQRAERGDFMGLGAGATVPSNMAANAPENLPEFAFDDAPIKDQAAAGLYGLFERDPGEFARWVSRNIPGYRTDYDKNGNPVIVNKETSKRYYVNRPGLSPTDFATAFADIITLAPFAGGGAKAGTALLGPTVGRVLGTGGGLAVGSMAQDLVASGMGSKKGIDLERALFMGGAGAGFEAALPFFRAAAPALRRVKTWFRGNKLTPRARAALGEVGIDPNTATPETIARLQKLMRSNPADDAAAARVADAQSMPTPVPLTRGQATQSPGQVALESQMKKGADDVAAPLRAAETDQLAALEANRESIQGAIGRSTGRVPGQGAREAQESLVQGRASLKSQVDDAYTAARGASAAAPAREVANIGRSIRRSLSESYDISAATSPRVSKLLSDLAGIQEAYPGASGVKLRALQTWRKQATNAASDLRGTSEGAAAREAVKMFDDALDDMVTRDLMSGDPAAVEAWKKAIGLRKQLGQKFQQKDVVAELTERLNDNSARLKVDPDDAVNYIFGRSSLGAKRGLAKDLKKMRGLLPEDEWGGIREEAFLRLFRNQPEGVPSGVKLSKELEKALREAPDSMRELFSNAEIEQMRQLARVARYVTEVPKVAQNANPSGTAAGNKAQAVIDRVAGGTGFLGRFTAGALRALLGRPSVEMRAAAAREAATRPVPRSPIPYGGAYGTGGAVGAANTDTPPNLFGRVTTPPK